MAGSIGTPLPIRIGGMWAAGDSASIPVGYCRMVRNHVIGPGSDQEPRLDARPQFTSDQGASGGDYFLMTWEDLTTNGSRLIAFNKTDGKFYAKSTTSETYTNIASSVASRIIDFTNYRGVLYLALDNGSGVPVTLAAYTGTTTDADITTEQLAARTVTAYLDRLFVTGLRALIFNNLGGTALDDAYSANPGHTTWNGANYIGEDVTTAAGVIGRITPTALTGAYAQVSFNNNQGGGVYGVWRCDLRNTHPSYDVPISLDVLVWMQRANTTAYTVGQVMRLVASNGFRYRCTFAGTSAGAPPAFGVVVGGDTVDGGVTWRCDGPEEIASVPVTVPARGTTAEWSTFFVDWSSDFGGAVHPPATFRIKFGNAYAAMTILTPIEMGFKDGVADGDPRKRNFGQQVTQGRFRYPFMNIETLTAFGYFTTVDLTDDVYWSDILQPRVWHASNYYRLTDKAGKTTAATTLSGRYFVFKRNSFWIFTGNTDQTSLDIIPIRRERVYNSIGCIGTKALDSMDDDLFFIAENEIYHYSSGGDPEPICGKAMREEIMARGSNWVELQSTYNLPLLKIDKKNRRIWVYTQKSRLYCFDMETKQWTIHEVNGYGFEVRDMQYNSITENFYVSFGGQGVSRLDASVAHAQDAVNSSGTTYPLTKDIVARTLEFKPRKDTIIHGAGILHLATAAQAGQTLTASVSMDRGLTYPWSDQVTLDLADARNQIDLFESGPSLTVKVSHVGDGGAAIWSVSGFDAVIDVQGDQWPQSRPTPMSATL